ncbi:MAG: MFS transporter [Dehalococcoidia bacterium]|nr:MFS transporter [Dehalococcoidia bacterium]MDD5494294.1 MFS transporter [Dehalococcoidia bacterium]
MTSPAKKTGFYGWTLLPILCLVYSLPIGFAFYGPPVIYQFMQKELHWQRGEINLGYTIIGMLLGLGALIIPWLINRFGPRNTLIIGAIITTISTIMMAICGQIYPVYLLLCVFTGLGISFGTVVPVQTLVLLWFNVRRALAMGLVLGGGAIGGFIYPQIVSNCIIYFGGDWRVGWYVIALACFIGAIIAVLAVKNRPEELGQYPDGISPEALKETARQAKQKTVRTYRSPINWKLREALKTRSLWSIIFGTSFIFFLWQTVLTQTPAHLSDRGFSPSDPVLFLQPAFVYGLILAFSIVGRLSVSFLGELIETRFFMAISGACLITGGLLFWIASRDNLWAAYSYPLLVGFGFGATYVSFPLILGNYFGTESFHNISGIANPIGSVIQFTAPFLAGKLYDLNGNYNVALIIACSVALIGSLVILFCRPPKRPDTAAI